MKRLMLFLCVLMCVFSICLVSCNESELDGENKTPNGDETQNPTQDGCSHLWMKGVLDIEAQSTKDGVFTKECYICKEKVSVDVRTTITREEYASALTSEYLSQGVTFSQPGSNGETWYWVTDENGAHAYVYYSQYGVYRYLLDDGYDFSRIYEEFKLDYSYDSLEYDEEQKYYVTNENNKEVKLYFANGKLLARKSGGAIAILIDVGNSSTKEAVMKEKIKDLSATLTGSELKNLTCSIETKTEIKVEHLQQIIERFTAPDIELYQWAEGNEPQTGEHMASFEFGQGDTYINLAFLDGEWRMRSGATSETKISIVLISKSGQECTITFDK